MWQASQSKTREYMSTIAARIATELGVKTTQTQAAIDLLDGGATVPFVARYRKEVTQGLDDTQLRNLEDRLRYLRELHERRESVLKSIDEQGKMTDALRQQIDAADTKAALEDLYLPYKPKRRTKAQIAREAGLAALAEGLLGDPTQQPEATASAFVNADKGVADVAAALEGAKQILMEDMAERADIVGPLRDMLWQDGVLSSSVIEGKAQEGAKFSDYFEYAERIANIPSHRALALFRGRDSGILALQLDVPHEDAARHPCEYRIASAMGIADRGRAADSWLLAAVRWAWKVKIHTRLDLDSKMRLREAAEEEAIQVFATNLKDVLLAAPAGLKATMGLDPGLRTGVKVAVVDGTGKLVDTATIYPHEPKRQWNQSLATLSALAKKHRVALVAVGNGTASRETDKLAQELIQSGAMPGMSKVMVSEAGASVYSASELAAKEFPDLDVSLRGAVSIARRLQDPLAELVKIEPKSIGVGQYQHDVNQTALNRSLGAVVEDCVNAVGVDVNSASAALLSYVSGLSSTLAQNIVSYRDENGAFNARTQLKKVPRLGPKAFEQCAGFLRIREGKNPLDASAVHPEAYPLVKRISEASKVELRELIGNSSLLKGLKPQAFTDEHFGLPTVTDIISELDKPGRDPRPEFKTARLQEGVETLSDLREGMILEGTVTNVTNFGAFVDVGVHQDGLVHISAMSHTFVKDPRDVVKAGDIVKVKVMEVDLKRKRIGMSMRLEDSATGTERPAKSTRAERSKAPRATNNVGKSRGRSAPDNAPDSALAHALKSALKRS